MLITMSAELLRLGGRKICVTQGYATNRIAPDSIPTASLAWRRGAILRTNNLCSRCKWEACVALTSSTAGKLLQPQPAGAVCHSEQTDHDAHRYKFIQ